MDFWHPLPISYAILYRKILDLLPPKRVRSISKGMTVITKFRYKTEETIFKKEFEFQALDRSLL